MSKNPLDPETKPDHPFRSTASSPSTRTQRRRSGAQAPADPKDWDDVDQRLGYLGEVVRQLRVLRDEFEQKVAVLKQQWLESSRSLSQECTRLQDQIERFYWAHREEVLAQGRKSVELSFGRLGTRHSRSVVIEDATVARLWLEAHGLERFLRTRTEVNREAIRSTLLTSGGIGASVSHALLACPAIRLEESEQFWYTLLQSPAQSAPPQSTNLGCYSLQTATGSQASRSRRKRPRSLNSIPVLPEATAPGGSHDQAVQ